MTRYTTQGNREPYRTAPEAFTVEAWGANAIKFIADRGLTSDFNDWCGGWPCPVTPQMIEASPAVLEALRHLQSYGCPICSGDCGSANPPVSNCPMQEASRAIARAVQP